MNNDHDEKTTVERFMRSVETATAGKTAELLITALTTFLVLTLKEFANLLPPQWYASMKAPVLMHLLLGSLLLNLVLAYFVLFYRHQLSQKFTIKYGMLWDKDKHPHCPSCRKPSVEYDDWGFHGLSYHCSNCKINTTLKDATGKKVTPEIAMAELK